MSDHNCEDRSITAEGMRRDFATLTGVMALWAARGATKMTS